MNRTKELDIRKKFIKNAPLEDYLMEDSPVYNQNFFILSYLLPNDKNELKYPIIKVRGSFKNQEDCNSRIQKLKNIDTYFNMFVCEVGKFGTLLPEDELKKNEDIDVEYRESLLNTMVKEYQENKQKSDQEFQKRKNLMKERAKFEGSKEGQELLSNQKENPVVVKIRIETMSKHKNELQQRIDEVNEIIELSEKQLNNDYTTEEIKEANEKYEKEYPDTKFTIDDLIVKNESDTHKNLFSSEDVFINKKENSS